MLGIYYPSNVARYIRYEWTTVGTILNTWVQVSIIKCQVLVYRNNYIRNFNML